MAGDLHLAGPTVTLFGDRDSLDAALSRGLGRRGSSTHSVTTPTGWLASSPHAIIRVASQAGARAISDLAAGPFPPAHVVVVCETSDDDGARTRVEDLCRRSGDRHNVSVIWHDPLVPPLPEGADESVTDADDLAAAIIDEVGVQATWTTAPSFTTRTFEPHRHRRRG